MNPAEPRHGAQLPVHGGQGPDDAWQATIARDQGVIASQARARYLRLAGGGLVAAFLGSVSKPAELRVDDGRPFLVFSTVPDGARSADEAPSSIRVEYFGDVEALAPRLTKGTQIYAEGRLTLNTWTGKDGAERTGLRVLATHVEVLSGGAQ